MFPHRRAWNSLFGVAPRSGLVSAIHKSRCVRRFSLARLYATGTVDKDEWLRSLEEQGLLEARWAPVDLDSRVVVGDAARHEDLHSRMAMQQEQSAVDSALEQLEECLRHPIHGTGTAMKDLSHVCAIAIDPRGDGDSEDALSIEYGGGTCRLMVHICAPGVLPSLASPKSPLFNRAVRLGRTQRFPRHAPLCPPRLSSALSFHTRRENVALTFAISLDITGELTHCDVMLSKIRPVTKMTHEDAARAITIGDGEAGDTLRTLAGLATLRKKYRKTKGALFTHRTSGGDRNARTGQIRHTRGGESVPTGHHDGPHVRDVVEEAMLCAGEGAGLYAKAVGLPLIYRTQDAPSMGSDEQMSRYWRDPPGNLTSAKAILHRYIQTATLPPSRLKTIPGGHFALGLPLYASVSSPLRRAVDLINQVQLVRSVMGDEGDAKPLSEWKLRSLVSLELDASLKRADESDGAAVREKVLQKLFHQKGAIHQAVVLSVQSQPSGTQRNADGNTRGNTLKNSSSSHDKSRNKSGGATTKRDGMGSAAKKNTWGKVYIKEVGWTTKACVPQSSSPGDVVKMRIVYVDPESGRLDLEVVS